MKKNLTFTKVLVMVLAIVLISLPNDVSAANQQVSNDVIAISAGKVHTLTVRGDGSVWAWGKNDYGQLGDGTITPKLSPIKVSGLSDVVAVSAGEEFSLALRKDGTVWAWGYAKKGIMGYDSDENKLKPEKVNGIDGIIAISAGSSHSLALKKDGTVWAWGSGSLGVLATSDVNKAISPQQIVGLDDVRSISAGSFSSIAIKNDGTMWAWGHRQFSPIPIKGISNIQSVASGSFNFIALLNDGTVWTWEWQAGGNSRLIDGDISGNKQQVKPLVDIVKVANSENHSLALGKDGTVWAWGSNYDGQIDDSKDQKKLKPVKIDKLTKTTEIAASNVNSFALQGKSEIYAWGADYEATAKLSSFSQLIITPQFDRIEDFSDDVAWVKLGGLWGLIDFQGNWMISPAQSGAGSFNDGIAKSTNLAYFIDKKGNKLVEFTDDRQEASEGLVSFVIVDPKTKKEKWGFKNTSGKVIIQPQFDTVGKFVEGLAVVEKNGKLGMINKQNKLVVPYKYFYISDMKDGVAIVSNDRYYKGLIDKNGKEIVKPQYDDMFTFEYGRAVVKKNGKYGYIDKSGKVKIKIEYMDAFSFTPNSGGVAIVADKSNEFVIDVNGKKLTKLNYDVTSDFYDRVAPFIDGKSKAQLHGLLDSKGTIVLKPTYDGIEAFSEGLARVKKDGMFGFIDTKGKLVFPLIYNNALEFKNGYAQVNYNGKWGYIKSK